MIRINFILYAALALTLLVAVSAGNHGWAYSLCVDAGGSAAFCAG